MVDLPEAERPVSQIVRPRWLRWVSRSLRVRAGAWKVMLLYVHVALVLYSYKLVDGCCWVSFESIER